MLQKRGAIALTLISFGTATLLAQSATDTSTNYDQAIVNVSAIYSKIGDGISDSSYSPKSLEALDKYIDAEISEYCSALPKRDEIKLCKKAEVVESPVIGDFAKKDGKVDKKNIELALDFLKEAKAVIEDAAEEKTSPQRAYALGLRILYSTLAMNKGRIAQKYPEALKQQPANAEEAARAGFVAHLENLIRFMLMQRQMEAAQRAQAAGQPVPPNAPPPNLDLNKRIPQLIQAIAPRENVKIAVPTDGKVLAERESRFLPVSSDSQEYLTDEQIQEMTAEELGRVDISDKHPAWYSREQLKKIDKKYPKEMTKAEARWKNIEDRVEEVMSAKLAEDFGEGFKYSLENARKVLFLEKVKSSATSPKVDTVDTYGEGWKLKWGPEVQSENIANRLYIAAGGRFTDLVYANGPGLPTPGAKGDLQQGVILILGASSKDGEPVKNSCGGPQTLEKLQSCLKIGNKADNPELADDGYGFNLEPQVLSSNTVDEAFYNNVLKPLGITQSFEELKGRVYVTFKESMVEFQSGKAYERGGPTAFSSTFAKQDRVARGSVLFNMWIANRDAKDDNNKAFIVKSLNKEGEIKKSYVEGQHDNGFSLGGHFEAADMLRFNNYNFPLSLPGLPPQNTGNQMIMVEEVTGTNGAKAITFGEPLVYLPHAWKAASYSDLLWMADNILTLGAASLKWVADQTNWPKFMKHTLVMLLMKRQNMIATVFERDQVNAKEFAADSNYTLRLSKSDFANPSAFKAAEGIDLSLIAESASAILGENESVEIPVIVNGELVNLCAPVAQGQAPGPGWVLADSLQKKQFPSGLIKRISRLNDDQADVGCNAQEATALSILNLRGD